jgi:hypothetical protein
MLKRGIKCGGIQLTEFGKNNLEKFRKKISKILFFFIAYIYKWQNHVVVQCLVAALDQCPAEDLGPHHALRQPLLVAPHLLLVLPPPPPQEPLLLLVLLLLPVLLLLADLPLPLPQELLPLAVPLPPLPQELLPHQELALKQ